MKFHPMQYVAEEKLNLLVEIQKSWPFKLP